MNILDCQKEKQRGSRPKQVSLEAKNVETEAVLLWAHHEDSLEKKKIRDGFDGLTS